MHIKYRKDIDGLRAIAVLGVVIYHALPKFFKGGFVGVDIFFVISGFLITSIIQKNIGTFSFFDFYARRIKRIFPALITVLLACILFGHIALIASEYKMLGNHVKYNSFFLINFALLKESGYFNIESDLKPLLHLWSLSIEEQFYILWPFIFYLAYKRNINGKSITFLLILISFYFNIRFTNKNPEEAFYLPFTRGWELLSGCLLAQCAEIKSRYISSFKSKLNYHLGNIIYAECKTPNHDILADTISWLGFLINVVCILSLKDNCKFPGWYSLLPIIGTIMIIGAGPDSWVNRKILSSKVLVWVGLISYPLYLWHWPLLSFTFIIEDPHPKKIIIYVVLALSILLAYLTYRFIEQPIRLSQNRKFWVIILCGMMALIGYTGHYIKENQGLPNRPSQKNVSDFGENLLAIQYAGLINCKEIINNTAHYCAANSLKPKYFVFGDSHALGLGYGITKFSNLPSMFMSYNGTLPFLNYISYNYKDSSTKAQVTEITNEFVKNIQIIAHQESPQYIIFTARATLYLSGHGFSQSDLLEKEVYWSILPKSDKYQYESNKVVFLEEYIKLIQDVEQMGKKVIFVIDHPELGFNPKSCIKKPFSILKKDVHDCTIDKKLVDERQKEYRELIFKMKERIPSLLIYDSTSAFCDNKKCSAKDGDNILYVDGDHLSEHGAKLLIKDFENWLRKHNILDLSH